MDIESTNPPAGVVTYLGLLYEVWPMMLLAFLVHLCNGWRTVKESYLQRNFAGTVINIILSSAVMAVLAVAVVWVMPLIGYEPDPAAQMGVVVLVSASGLKSFDAFVRKRQGARIVRGGSAEDLSLMKDSMTAEQQARHMEICPYRKDCSKCKDRHCGGSCQGDSHG